MLALFAAHLRMEPPSEPASPQRPLLAAAAAAKVQSAALRGWSLLLSTLPAWQLTAADIECQLASLVELLQSPDVEVRAAAGEAVALLYHSYGLASLDAGGAEDSSYIRHA